MHMVTYEVVIRATLHVPGDGMTDQDIRRMERSMAYEAERELWVHQRPENVHVVISRMQELGQ